MKIPRLSDQTLTPENQRGRNGVIGSVATFYGIGAAMLSKGSFEYEERYHEVLGYGLGAVAAGCLTVAATCFLANRDVPKSPQPEQSEQHQPAQHLTSN